jgi:hypothetical protein
MSRDSLPYSPQMRNGGSPPAHLSSSSDTLLNTPYWLRYNWLQPPPHAPDWVLGWALCNNWLLVRATHEYQQAAGLLPPWQLGGEDLLPSITRPPTSSGRVPQMTYGRMSVPANKPQPANAFSKSTPLMTATRLLIANDSLISEPLVNTRMLLFANAFLMSASLWTKGFPNTPPLYKGWWQHAPSSCGPQPPPPCLAHTTDFPTTAM